MGSWTIPILLKVQHFHSHQMEMFHCLLLFIIIIKGHIAILASY